jgi:hypothetical protein
MAEKRLGWRAIAHPAVGREDPFLHHITPSLAAAEAR